MFLEIGVPKMLATGCYSILLKRLEPEQPLVFENIANHCNDFTKKRTIKDILNKF